MLNSLFRIMFYFYSCALAIRSIAITLFGAEIDNRDIGMCLMALSAILYSTTVSSERIGKDVVHSPRD